MSAASKALSDAISFTIGLMFGMALMYGFFMESEPDIEAMRAEQAYEYCWRVDAYRQDKGMRYPRGHDDFRGIYERVCPGRE
jgi:hypothetical protein